MSSRAEEASIDQTVADMRFFTENEGKLRLESPFTRRNEIEVAEDI